MSKKSKNGKQKSPLQKDNLKYGVFEINRGEIKDIGIGDAPLGGYENGTYTGKMNMDNGHRTGIGRMDYDKFPTKIKNYDPDYHIYYGNFEDDLRSGFGKMTYYDNDYTYEGDWKEGNKNGFGKEIHKDGSIFVGEWENDMAVVLNRVPTGNLEQVNLNNLTSIEPSKLVKGRVYLLFEKMTKNKTKVKYVNYSEVYIGEPDSESVSESDIVFTREFKDIITGEEIEIDDDEFERDGEFSIFLSKTQKIISTKKSKKVPIEIFNHIMSYGGIRKKTKSRKKTIKVYSPDAHR
jgi:hypothetical protein